MRSPGFIAFLLGVVLMSWSGGHAWSDFDNLVESRETVVAAVGQDSSDKDWIDPPPPPKSDTKPKFGPGEQPPNDTPLVPIQPKPEGAPSPDSSPPAPIAEPTTIDESAARIELLMTPMHPYRSLPETKPAGGKTLQTPLHPD